MKILSNNADKYITSILKSDIGKICAILIFGEDYGVLSSRVSAVKIALQDYEVFAFSSENDAESVGSLVNSEYFTDSFISSKKLIVVNVSGAVELRQFEDFVLKVVENCNKDNFVVFACDFNIDAKNKIRKLFEDSVNLACIPCYADEDDAIKNIAVEKLKKNNYVASPDVVGLIVQKFHGSRNAMLMELDKLMLYKNEDKNISIEDIENVMISNIDETFFTGIEYFCNFEVENLERILDKMEIEGIPISIFITNLVNYFFKLLDIFDEIKKGQQIDDILKAKFIFFKQIPTIKKHLKSWNKNKIINTLQDLEEMEFISRINPPSSSKSIIILCLRFK